LKNLTINRRNRASAKGASQAVTPPPDPPAERYTKRIVMNVFGKRFELTSRVEVHRIAKGPAIVIEMPRRRAIEQ
jgi:hypothetical protein